MAVAWLDAARYADSYGYQSDQLNTQWPYRDWVVRALNDNLPYDQFLTWQLAGDLLKNPTPRSDSRHRVQSAAPADERRRLDCRRVARRKRVRPRPHVRHRDPWPHGRMLPAATITNTIRSRCATTIRSPRSSIRSTKTACTTMPRRCRRRRCCCRHQRTGGATGRRPREGCAGPGRSGQDDRTRAGKRFDAWLAKPQAVERMSI